jgi:ABC-2 type transporter
MNSYLALTTIELKLALRDKQVLFFNYVFPLILFFFLGSMMHAERSGGAIAFIVTDVLVIGILGNGFFGAGIRAVQEREQNILRRYKVTPITPVPILVASLATACCSSCRRCSSSSRSRAVCTACRCRRARCRCSSSSRSARWRFAPSG